MSRKRVWVAIAAVVVLAIVVFRAASEPRDEHDMTPLMRAAARGDASEVRRLIAAHARVNAHVHSNDLIAFIHFIEWMQDTPSRDVGWTPLLYAAQASCTECVRALVAAGADVKATGRGGETALQQAAFRGNVELVEFLVSKGADINASGAVHIAATQRDTSMLQFLITHGANVNGTRPVTPYGKAVPPLLGAVMSRNADAVRILLDAGAAPEVRNPQNNWSVLRIAHRQGLTDIEQLLRRAGAKDDGVADEQLLAAMQSHDEAAVRAALDAGANASAKNTYGDPLICVAADNGDAGIVRALLDHNANVNARNNFNAEPLWLAISRRHPEAAAVLIRGGANVNAQENKPLTAAAAAGEVATMLLLIDAGADVNYGRSHALRTAAQNGKVEAVRLLLDRGSDARSVSEDGESALHGAASGSSPEVLNLLIARGAPLNGKQLNGWTPLMRAASAGKAENVKALLAAGADHAIKDDQGKTAYDYAARYPEVQALLR